LALLLVAGAAAATILFAKYQLEGLRGRIQQELETRTGAVLQAGAIDAHGLRGIRIQDFSAEFTTDPGHTLRVEAPVVNIYIDFLDLFYGELNIERLQMNGALVRLFRPLDQPWLPPRDASESNWTASPPPFRLTGQDCSIEVINAVGESNLKITSAGFDVYHLPDGQDMSGRLWGNIGDDVTKSFVITGRYLGPDDFDVQVQATRLDAADVNRYLPEQAQVIATGAAEPFVRITGYPGNPLIVSLKSPFHELTLRDHQEWFGPASGTFNALATYDLSDRLLTLTTAEVHSNQVGGQMDGTIQFGELPEADLRLQIDRLPVQQLLDEALAERTAAYGSATLKLGEPYTVTLRLQGTLADPSLSVEARADNATLAFSPAQDLLPAARLDLDGLRLNWTPDDGLPEAYFSIRDGEIEHAKSDLHVEDLAGIVKVTADALVAESLQGSLAGNPVVGRGRYALAEKKGEFDASGVIANIENTLLGELIPKTSLGGSASVRCSGHIDEKRYMLDLAIDATQTSISHDWWFHKAAGIGASIQGLNLEILPRQRIGITGMAELGTSRANVTAELDYRKGKWDMKSVRAKSEQLDIASIGRCLQVPYGLSTGTGTNAVFEWDRVSGTPKASIVKLGGDIDQVTAQPSGSEHTLRASGLHVEVRWDNSEPEERTGSLLLDVASAQIPGFGIDWMRPLRPEDPELLKQFPEESRDWIYTLRSANLAIPPWEGTAFTGTAFTSTGKTGLQEFSAAVGNGRIEGAYSVTKPENVSTLDIHWSQVPVHFFLDHLDWPRMMDGDISGDLTYSMDRDDPGTLTGKGTFEVFDGQFSADYLFALFEKQFTSNLAGLPPSLKFRQLKADLVLDGDIIKTPEVILQGESLRITADGQFVTHGDMDYNLRATLSPDTAKRIPLLRDYFNLEGHRFTQNDLELAFNISGPVFNPSGSVTELPPMGVTLVSGAAEMTGEAIKVIDLPRQILLDLFKIGGGIVGPPR
jgi:hypothetical protein